MLIDGHNRVVDYLRVSVTERCNFRCQYCMPEKPFSWVPQENLMSYEDLFKFIKAGIDEGIQKVRITGGEPLLRANLDVLIKMIRDYKEDIDLALTTNGFLLKQSAKILKDAGLDRVNVSLDSLDAATAQHIAQKDVLADVIAGFDACDEVGLKVKINTVPLHNINAHELIALLDYCKDRGYQIRFIEYMENHHANNIKGLNAQEIKDVIAQEYNFVEVPRMDASPAQKYRLDDGYEFGIIEPHKIDFCDSCNRIRLTAEGYLIPCLYFEDALSIKEAIGNDNVEEAVEILRKVLKNKPEKNKWGSEEGNETSTRAFYETGG
ncbi:MAG: GTP 3',8-cyclase MoaA [Campylobacterota bacterium]|nr:GTP 3',8-cyclase MoaA [Campylobacterota bacterium]